MASNLQETKVMLLVACRHLTDVRAALRTATPDHTNTLDAELQATCRELERDATALYDKTYKALGKI